GGAQGHHCLRVRQLEDRDAVVLAEHPVVREKVATNRLGQIARRGRPVAGLFNHPGGDFGLETEQHREFRHGNLPRRVVSTSGATRVSSEPALRAITPLSGNALPTWVSPELISGS